METEYKPVDETGTAADDVDADEPDEDVDDGKEVKNDEVPAKAIEDDDGGEG